MYVKKAWKEYTMHPYSKGIALVRASTSQLLRSAKIEGRGKREIPEKTRRPTASSGTIPTCGCQGVTRPGIEPGLPWRDARRLTSQSPRPRGLLDILGTVTSSVSPLFCDATNLSAVKFRKKSTRCWLLVVSKPRNLPSRNALSLVDLKKADGFIAAPLSEIARNHPFPPPNGRSLPSCRNKHPKSYFRLFNSFGVLPSDLQSSGGHIGFIGISYAKSIQGIEDRTQTLASAILHPYCMQMTFDPTKTFDP
ncbi:hypothetical protein PR048_003296 [Dryococelus australis]|uniref:Uncharacterized protein n=1 Tax=Dryococelus australis TaxID=614101 RepID=A0ABQ9IPR9_9NEOP|nr:hypothetical protein PR048_003296 [Dryococelus australis]